MLIVKDISLGVDLPGPGQPHTLIRASQAFRYHSSRLEFEVPAGFLCDGASVPAALWAVLSANWIDMLLAGICHDYLYRTNATIKLDGNSVTPTRVQADVIFRGIMEETGIGKVDQAKAYYGVRVGGGSSFQKKPVL